MLKLICTPSLRNTLQRSVIIRQVLRVTLLVMTISIIQTTTVLAQDYLQLPVSPLRTYLRTNNDPQSIDTVPINLEAYGLAAGDKIRIERVGAFRYSKGCPSCVPPIPPYPDNAVDMVGVFSTSNVLLSASNLSRVPGAIAIGVPCLHTPDLLRQSAD